MFRFALCLSVAFLIGCGGGGRDYTDTSRDPEAFAGSVKQVVINTVARARTSDEPEDNIGGIVDLLEDLSGRPVGSYRDTYDQVLAKAREIVAELQAAGVGKRPANLNDQLDDLEDLVRDLPDPSF